MKAKLLLEPQSENSNESQMIFCETHPQEEVERVCSLNNCKKKPLICWQCLLDDKEHSDSHRQHFLKLQDFLKKFLDEFEEVTKKNKSQEIPSDLLTIIEDEEKNLKIYENICENQKEQIEEEFSNFQKEIEKFFSTAIETFNQAIDKKYAIYLQHYSSIKTKIEDYFGISKQELNKQRIVEDIQSQKENSSLSSYFLSLKQKLLPKIPLLKDPGFTSLLNKLTKMNDPIPTIEEFSKIKKIQTESMKVIEKNIHELQTELSTHFRLENRSFEENFSNIFKKNNQNISLSIRPTVMPLKESSLPMCIQSETKKISLDLKTIIKTSHTKQINAIKIINEELIATGSKDKKIKIWKMYNKECLCTLEGHKDNVCCLGTLNQSKVFPLLISGGGNLDSTLIIWDLETRKSRHVLLGHQSSITTVISLNDGKTIISGSYDNNIIIWNAQEAKARFVLRKHSAMVSALKMFKEGNILASASWDKSVALWKISYDNENNFLKCDFMYSILENFAILTLGSSLLEPHRLIYAGTNKKFFAYNIENKEKEKEFEGSHFGVNELVVVESCFLDNCDNFFVIGLSNNDACLRMWEGKNCEEVLRLKDTTENFWINNLNTGPKIEVFSNFENKTQVALVNSSETNFSVNIYDLKTE